MDSTCVIDDPFDEIVNETMNPSSSVPEYASTKLSLSTFTSELWLASEVLYSIEATSVIVLPLDDIVNVEI